MFQFRGVCTARYFMNFPSLKCLSASLPQSTAASAKGAHSASTCFAVHCGALSCKYRLSLCTQTVCFGAPADLLGLPAARRRARLQPAAERGAPSASSCPAVGLWRKTCCQFLQRQIVVQRRENHTVVSRSVREKLKKREEILQRIFTFHTVGQNKTVLFSTQTAVLFVPLC